MAGRKYFSKAMLTKFTYLHDDKSFIGKDTRSNLSDDMMFVSKAFRFCLDNGIQISCTPNQMKFIEGYMQDGMGFINKESKASDLYKQKLKVLALYNILENSFRVYLKINNVEEKSALDYEAEINAAVNKAAVRKIEKERENVKKQVAKNREIEAFLSELKPIAENAQRDTVISTYFGVREANSGIAALKKLIMSEGKRTQEQIKKANDMAVSLIQRQLEASDFIVDFVNESAESTKKEIKKQAQETAELVYESFSGIVDEVHKNGANVAVVDGKLTVVGKKIDDLTKQSQEALERLNAYGPQITSILDSIIEVKTEVKNGNAATIKSIGEMNEEFARSFGTISCRLGLIEKHLDDNAKEIKGVKKAVLAFGISLVVLVVTAGAVLGTQLQGIKSQLADINGKIDNVTIDQQVVPDNPVIPAVQKAQLVVDDTEGCSEYTIFVNGQAVSVEDAILKTGDNFAVVYDIYDGAFVYDVDKNMSVLTGASSEKDAEVSVETNSFGEVDKVKVGYTSVKLNEGVSEVSTSIGDLQPVAYQVNFANNDYGTFFGDNGMPVTPESNITITPGQDLVLRYAITNEAYDLGTPIFSIGDTVLEVIYNEDTDDFSVTIPYGIFADTIGESQNVGSGADAKSYLVKSINVTEGEAIRLNKYNLVLTEGEHCYFSNALPSTMTHGTTYTVYVVADANYEPVVKINGETIVAEHVGKGTKYCFTFVANDNITIELGAIQIVLEGQEESSDEETPQSFPTSSTQSTPEELKKLDDNLSVGRGE